MRFIPIENLREALQSDERIFCLIPLTLAGESDVQASLSHTISESVRSGKSDYVSANHCQLGSNVLLYKFVRCQFVAPVLPSPSSPRRVRRAPCPPKQLWNPTTKRCIGDTARSRKRLGGSARR
jgi:hypothetical protein